jgi:hypothetical protein
MGSWLGAGIYILVEVLPDFSLLPQLGRAMGRRNRISHLEKMVQINPAAGNYEELGDLYLEDEKYRRAKECFDKAISSRTDSPDPFYKRGICEVELGDFPAAEQDLQRVVTKDPRYDLQRAAALLAHSYARNGKTADADELFRRVTETSTISETMLNYADFLRSQGKLQEAREWANRVLAKKGTLPTYLKRRERPWFRKANALLKQLPA